MAIVIVLFAGGMNLVDESEIKCELPDPVCGRCGHFRSDHYNDRECDAQSSRHTKCRCLEFGDLDYVG